MVQKRSRSRAVKTPRNSTSTGLRALVLLMIVLGVAPVIHRGLWRWNERSVIGRAVDTVRKQGCLSCHPRDSVGFRWRADGNRPQDAEVITDALQRGRPAVPGMPGPMPAMANRIGRGTFDRLVTGAEVVAGVVEMSDEAEVRIGMTIAHEMGCFDCHGPMGAGGVANPGTVGGLVPGFFGLSFARQAESPEGIEGVIRNGKVARRAWWMPWKRPPLDMPAYGGRLDSTEIALLVYAIRSVPADPHQP